LTRPDYKKANAILKRAHAHCGTVTVYAVRVRGVQGAKVLKQDWAHIGCDVTIRRIDDPDAFMTRIGHRGEPFDAAVFTGMGWLMDYLDPSDFFNILFDGRTIRAENNSNLSYFNVPEVNRRITRADQLRGPSRLRAYERLDRLITVSYAPWVAVGTYANYVTLLSKRVDGYFAQPFCGNPSIGVAADLAALRLSTH
jgi:peptide/nickel transport system substrate-binding protein